MSQDGRNGGWLSGGAHHRSGLTRRLPCGLLLWSAGLMGGVAQAQAPDAASQPPRVIFSQQHAVSNKVAVGDRFPSARLLDLNGQPMDWQCPADAKFCLVLVWSQELAAAREAYRLFAARWVEPYRSDGLVGVAINHGDPVDVVASAAETQGSGITTWLDADHQLWTQIATDRLPRLYLLDGQGKVLWMDIEFSQGTQRDLLQALHYFGGWKTR